MNDHQVRSMMLVTVRLRRMVETTVHYGGRVCSKAHKANPERFYLAFHQMSTSFLNGEFSIATDLLPSSGVVWKLCYNHDRHSLRTDTRLTSSAAQLCAKQPLAFSDSF